MKLISMATIGSLTLMVSGCSAFYPPAQLHQLQNGSTYIADTDASRRLAVMIPRPGGAGFFVCTEPSPDVALQLTDTLLAQAQVNVAGKTVDVTAQQQFAQAVVQLAQRSQTLMFLRESLYRLCEQSINQNLNSDQTMQLYTLAMQTALKLSEADLAKNQSDMAKNQADLAKSLQDPKVRELWEKTIGTASAPASLNNSP